MITVAICTYNRSASLRRTLDSLLAMTQPPSGAWELLVLDNNSNDDTCAVTEDYATNTALPIRYAFEGRQGKANALNHATDLARGDYILWTDDDVMVSKGWLTAYMEAIEREPDVVLLGGPIRPRFEQEPPSWLRPALSSVAGAYALLDLGPDALPLSVDGPFVPFGANMAVRTAQQRRYRYDPKLGPGSPLGILGDDTTVARAILADGHPGCWVPAAGVDHVIPLARQSVAYLRRWYSSYGFLTEVLAHERCPDVGPDPAQRRWMLRALLVAELRYYSARLLRSPERWAAALADAAHLRGRLRFHREAMRPGA
jgi:glucosyl-dolichyl phosphate glucuronosyltransferase